MDVSEINELTGKLRAAIRAKLNECLDRGAAGLLVGDSFLSADWLRSPAGAVRLHDVVQRAVPGVEIVAREVVEYGD